MFKRIFHIMIVAFGLAALAACSSDNDSNALEAPKPQANIVVTVTLDDNEANLGNLVFAFYNSAGRLINIYSAPFVNGKKYTYSTTTAATHLMVVGNVETSVIGNASTTTDLSTDYGYLLGNVRYDELPMVGNADLTLVGGGTTDITVPLSRIVARVGLDNITINVPTYLGTFTPTDVFMYRVNDEHHWYDINDLWLGRDVASVSDGAITGEDNAGGDTVRTYLGTRITSSLSLPSSSDGKTKIIFYVYPHGFGNPTKLVVKGYWTDVNNNTTVTYYPIVVNHVYDELTVHDQTPTTYKPTDTYLDDSRIDANRIYMIDMTIVGKGLPHPDDKWDNDRDNSITDIRTAVTPWQEENDTVYWDIIK